ncbi:hypothetical protein F9C07_2100705 [Aspergillus flavus]|uniref:Uncharacterized protein n=1 Tax=Aspergillus flavus (strain ATCC 200026 / FGSC A1120 / IAM 13836 / NRRL 3357 / JCM 12722 / SRRC 167) TaxID=332952 RepID=A0A7U2MG57_ASPFN|nr:hypothetical protein F9C07_2100705 [Aspergillus flavus]
MKERVRSSIHQALKSFERSSSSKSTSGKSILRSYSTPATSQLNTITVDPQFLGTMREKALLNQNRGHRSIVDPLLDIDPSHLDNPLEEQGCGILQFMDAYDLAFEDAEQNEALIRVRKDVILTTILATKTREEFGQGIPDSQCKITVYDMERLRSTHHGSTNSTRTIRRGREVDIGDLQNVLHVDPTPMSQRTD